MTGCLQVRQLVDAEILVSIDVQSNLVGWCQDLLTVDRVDPDDDFFDLGGDSLAGVQLLARIKDTYGVELRLSILFDARTARQLAEVIGRANSSTDVAPMPWCKLLPLQASGSRRPLFWIPGGNGTSVLLFQQVSQLLGSDQPSYGLEAKMPEPDEEFESISERARRFIDEIRLLQPQGPYSLLGFCGGGFVAYEMAQQLSNTGEDVNFLGIVECADDRHPAGRYGKARMRAERIAWRLKKFLAKGPAHIAGRSRDVLALAVKRTMLRCLGKPLPPLPSEAVDPYDKARRIVGHYQPTSYRGSAIIFIGRDTYQYSGLSDSVDPRLIWCGLCEGGSEVRTVPGDHTDMLREPSVYQFAEELKYGLQRFTAPHA